MTHTRVIPSLVLTAAVILGGWAWAQDTAPPEQPEEAPSVAAAGADELAEELATLSDEEKLERSAAKVQEMQEFLTTTTELLEDVREEEKDILKLNCINEKLAAMKGFLKVAEESYVALRQRVAQEDVEAANHHYTLIDVASQKVRNLYEEAQVCAGEVVRYAEDTVVDRTVDPDIADIDVIDRDDDDYDDSYARDRLPELTPFQ